MIRNKILTAAAAQLNVASSFTVLNTVTTTNSSTASLTMPSGILAGDLLLALTGAGSGSSSIPAITAAYGTGFTALNTVTGTYVITSGGSTFYYRNTGCTSYKIATGTESGTTIGGFVNSIGDTYILFHIRGRSPIVSVSTATNATSASTDPPLISLSTTSNTDTVVYYHLVAGGAAIPTFTSISPTPTLSASQAGVTYAGCASGVWLSQSVATYSFNAAASSNNQNRVPMMGQLVLTY